MQRPLLHARSLAGACSDAVADAQTCLPVYAGLWTCSDSSNAAALHCLFIADQSEALVSLCRGHSWGRDSAGIVYKLKIIVLTLLLGTRAYCQSQD